MDSALLGTRKLHTSYHTCNHHLLNSVYSDHKSPMVLPAPSSLAAPGLKLVGWSQLPDLQALKLLAVHPMKWESGPFSLSKIFTGI